jgi:hypothetical protein
MLRTIASFEANWDQCRKIGGSGAEDRIVSLRMWGAWGLASLHRDYKFALFWVMAEHETTVGAATLRVFVADDKHSSGERELRPRGVSRAFLCMFKLTARLTLLLVCRVGHFQRRQEARRCVPPASKSGLLAAFIVFRQSRALVRLCRRDQRNDQLGTRWRARRAARKPSDYESGGQEFESLRARQQHIDFDSEFLCDFWPLDTGIFWGSTGATPEKFRRSRGSIEFLSLV